MNQIESRILVVDGDQTVRDLIANLLQPGYVIETADSVPEARRKLDSAREPFDVALVADEVPTGNGHEPQSGINLMKYIRSNHSNTETLMMTESGGEAGVEALRAGAFHHLPKPLKGEELQILVSRAVDHRRLCALAKEKQIQQSDRMIALHETTIAITHELDRDALLAAITEQAVKLLKAKSGGIYQYHADLGELVVVAEHNRPEYLGRTIRVGEGMAGKLVQTGEPYMIIPDYNKWEGRSSIYHDNRDFGAVIEVLLKAKGDIIGVLYVDDDVGRSFNEADAQLLGLFADYAAITFVRTETVARDFDKARRIEWLSQISAEISSDLQGVRLEERLTLIAERAAEVLNADSCDILLIREGLLVWVASYGHAADLFEKGKTFEIASKPRGGLTGHIMSEGRLFNAWGSALINHWAVKAEYPEGENPINCHSLLALPMKKGDKAIGLLRAANKLDNSGGSRTGLHFTSEDELILSSFGQAVVLALESATLVEELIESRNWLDRLVGASPNGIIAADKAGRVTQFNKRAQEVLGYNETEARLLSVRDLYLDPATAPAIGKLLHINPDHRVIKEPSTVRSSSGEKIPIRLSATWLYDAKGERIGSVGYFEDRRAYNEVEGRLGMLLSAINLLTRSGNLKEGLQRLAKMIISATGRTFCRVLLLDGQSLVVEAAAPGREAGGLRWRPDVGRRIPVKRWSGLDLILAADRPKVLSRFNDNVRQNLDSFASDLDLEPSLEALLLAPLRIRTKTVGLLVVGEVRQEKARFSKEEKDLAAAIAAQTSLLIDRIQLHELEIKGHEDLRRLFEASNALVSTASDKMILEQFVEQAREAAGAGLVRVVMFDDQNRPRNQFVTGPMRGFDLTYAIRPDGITMRVLRTCEAVVIEDVAERPDVNPAYKDQGVRSAICLPMSLEGDRIGVVWINYDEPHHFSPHEKQALQLYVNKAAIAYENAQRIEELERLHTAAMEMADANDVTCVLQRIVSRATELFRADAATVWSYDQGSAKFIPDQLVAHRISEEVLDVFREDGPSPDGLTYQVINNILGYLEVPDTNESEPPLKPKIQTALEKEGIRSFAAIALSAGDEKVGVLYLSYKHKRRLREKEIKLLKNFAAYAALSLKRTRLSDAQQRSHKAAGAIARAITIGNLDLTLSSVAQGMQFALGCDAVVLYVYDALSNELHYPPSQIGVLDSRTAWPDNPVPPTSIVRRLLSEGELVVVEKVVEHELFKDSRFARDERIESLIAAPLRCGDLLVGIMFVNYRERHRVTKDELIDLDLFSNQAAVAVRNAQLFEETAKRLKEQREVADFAGGLLSTLSVQDILNRASVIAAGLFETDFSAVVLPDEQGELIMSAAFGWPQKLVGTYKLESGRRSYTGYTFETGQPVVVEDHDKETRFSFPPIAQRYGARSGMCVPMRAGERVIGAMLVHSKTARSFTDAEVTLLSVIAHLTAVALQSAQRFEEIERKSKQLKALYESGKAIAESSVGLELGRILFGIIEQAVHSISGAKKTKKIVGAMLLYDAKRDQLIFESVFPEFEADRLRLKNLEDRPLTKLSSERKRIGVIGRAFLSRQAQLVGRTDENEDYLNLGFGGASEIAVPILYYDEPLGVINLESDQPNLFDEHHLVTLEALAELAVVAIKNARQHDALKEIKGLVGNRTAIEWVKMVSYAWVHSIRREVGTALGQLALLENTIANGSYDEACAELVNLEETVTRIKEIPIVAPLSDEDRYCTDVPVNNLIRTYLEHQWMDPRYSQVKLEMRLEPDLDDRVSVHVSREWLRRAMEILIENAVRAVLSIPGPDKQRVTVSTQLVNQAVSITVTDTGPGIPHAIREKLFREKIEQNEGGLGAGVGLVLANLIIDTYGGEINVNYDSAGCGTAINVSLPGRLKRGNDTQSTE